jgi:kynurenine formamidase
MELTDLTHPIYDGMPVFPGEKGPALRQLATIGENGYRVKWMEMGSHTGTHIDAPAHLLPEGKTLDQYPVSHFRGKAAIISVPEGIHTIGLSCLQAFQPEISASEFILLRSGWSKYWGNPGYFSGFPVLSGEAARWLTGFEIKGIGLDTISADPVTSQSLPVHHILLRAGLIIIENLCFPEDFQATTGILHIFPLLVTEADGSPVRAVFMADDSE